ncbi:UNVERIFIED_CONTAM: hypothetical protein Slati_1879500, partial [Sesamum latifolium]
MSNLAKLDFVALDIMGKNYLSWVLDAEIHLDANGLGNTIKEGNEASNQDKAKAMIFLRHHLHEGLKIEYLKQYRKQGFTKYSELISCLLVAEQNNELLLKNHESRPTGSAPFPKVNVATCNHYNHELYRGRGRGRNHSRGRGYRGGN